MFNLPAAPQQLGEVGRREIKSSCRGQCQCVAEQFSQLNADCRFQLFGRNAQALIAGLMLECARHVVAVPHITLGGVHRDQRLSLAINHLARQKTGCGGPLARLALQVLRKQRLGPIPHLARDDGGMQRGMDCTFVMDLADVSRTLEHRIDLPARQRQAAEALAALRHHAHGRPDTLGMQGLGHAPHVAQRQVAREHVAHQCSMLVDDGQTSPVGGVTDRRSSAHPHTFGLGRGDLVADALGGNLAFKLRET